MTSCYRYIHTHTISLFKYNFFFGKLMWSYDHPHLQVEIPLASTIVINTVLAKISHTGMQTGTMTPLFHLE